jgi:hypothetical protein
MAKLNRYLALRDDIYLIARWMHVSRGTLDSRRYKRGDNETALAVIQDLSLVPSGKLG